MNLIEQPIKQQIVFEDLKPGMIVWLGARPDEKRMETELRRAAGSNAMEFWVINGAWGGTLYQEELSVGEGVTENHLFIIDERGTRHDQVYIVEIVKTKPRPVDDGEFEEIPF